MRILYGHDYYDAGLAYGQDKSVVFVRQKENPIYDKENKVHLIQNDRFFNLHSLNNKSHNKYINPVTVIIGDSKWFGLEIEIEYNKNIVFWDIETFKSWCDENEFVPKLTNWWNFDDGYNRNIFDSKHYSLFFDERKITSKELDYMITNKLSVVTCRYNTYVHDYEWLLNNDNLKKLQFYKVLNVFEAFQRISQWISGVLPSNGPPMIEITDDKIKIHKHGFDKKSFRKDKEQ